MVPEEEQDLILGIITNYIKRSLDVCEQCGTDWISDKDAEMLEDMVNDAKSKHTMIEVASFPDLLKVAS